MSDDAIDMRMFAQRAGTNVAYPAGSVVFNKGDPGSCMYVVQFGLIEMTIGDKVIGNPYVATFAAFDDRRGAEKLDSTRQGGLRALPH